MKMTMKTKMNGNSANDRKCPDMSALSGHSGNSTWYTVSDVAKELRVDKKTVYRMCQEGQLKHKRCGRAIRVPADALTNF